MHHDASSQAPMQWSLDEFVVPRFPLFIVCHSSMSYVTARDTWAFRKVALSRAWWLHNLTKKGQKRHILVLVQITNCKFIWRINVSLHPIYNLVITNPHTELYIIRYHKTFF